MEASDTLDVLHLVVSGALAERRRAVEIQGELADRLTPSLAQLDPVPRAAVEQARRLAALRTDLLVSGAFTYGALAEGRGAALPAIRQFVRRARDRNELFTVSHDNETLVPAFLLDEHLATKPAVVQAIAPLRNVGEDGWALWAWFVTPSGWLGGRRPAEVLDEAPALVVEAAIRRASNAA